MKPKKSFGQHFLTDGHVLQKIADLIEGDFILEVGPGTGALTELLTKKGKLVLVEADRDLVPGLKKTFPNAKIIQEDAAKINFDEISNPEAWTLVGNLPYNAGAAILNNAMSAENPPSHIVIMVQKEQADRMRAKPGEMGLLSVVVQLGYEIKKQFDVSPEAFTPKPRVDSTVLTLQKKQSVPNRESVIQLAKAGFQSRRKQLHKNIAAAGVTSSEDVKSALESLGLSKKARAQELSVEQWVELQEHFVVAK